MDYSFQTAWHFGENWPDWGAAPRGNLVRFDKAHQGEWLTSVIGKHPKTNADMVYHVIKCEICISTHLWPLSDPEDLKWFYSRKFYQETKPNYLKEYNEDKEWWMAIHGTILDAALPWLPTDLVAMLDVGAGPGYPSDAGKECGYITHALEPSPIAGAALHERGHVVFQETLGTFAGLENRLVTTAFPYYDLIYISEVLEHQPNPEDFLLQCYDLLAPGGVLVVVVPSDFTPAQAEACRRYALPQWWVVAPDHQHYFTPKTLQLMMRRCGFTQRFTRMTYPLIEYFMLEKGLCYVGNPALGRECHRQRMAIEMQAIEQGLWPELEAAYIANVEQRVGREIVGIWTKDE